MKKSSLVLRSLLCLSATATTASATTTYLTNFTKSNNIYTNLNEQFPHTGTGTPGTGVGTANAGFLFDPSSSAVQTAGYAPNYIASSNLVNNGVDFQLASNAAGQDFEEINSGPGITFAANVNDAQTVYMLMGAYDGQNCNVTFTGTTTSQTFNDVSLPDFNGGGPINTTASGLTDQTVFQTYDVGAGGSGNSITGDTNNYDLTEVAFTLQPSLAAEELQSISITSDGYDTLLLGVTVSSTGGTAPSTVPLPSAAWSALALLACLGSIGAVKKLRTN